jgi:hypothetical protein
MIAYMLIYYLYKLVFIRCWLNKNKRRWYIIQEISPLHTKLYNTRVCSYLISTWWCPWGWKLVCTNSKSVCRQSFCLLICWGKYKHKVYLITPHRKDIDFAQLGHYQFCIGKIYWDYSVLFFVKPHQVVMFPLSHYPQCWFSLII